jgi:uncharacterized protein YlzI (FlbEa/FlbD family)
MMIKLTNERWDKFYLNVSLIESIQELMGGKSQINLTTGRYVVCIESPEAVNRMLENKSE